MPRYSVFFQIFGHGDRLYSGTFTARNETDAVRQARDSMSGRELGERDAAAQKYGNPIRAWHAMLMPPVHPPARKPRVHNRKRRSSKKRR